MPRQRHDGWTPLRQGIFLKNLLVSQSVSQAAAQAGMSASSAYRLRKRPGAEAFARAWDAAVAYRPQAVTGNPLQRATVGVERPIMQGRRKLGTRFEPDNRLTQLLLMAHMPRKKVSQSGGPG